MRLLHALVLMTVAFHTSNARCRRQRPNPVAEALQNILSPANAERTMQMVQYAQRVANVPPNPPSHYPPPCNQPPFPVPLPYPFPVLPESCNGPIQIQQPNTLLLPTPQLIPNQIPVQVPAQFQLPNPMPQPPISIPQPPIPMPQPPIPMPQPSNPIVPVFQSQPNVILEQPCQRELFYPLEQPIPFQRELVYPSVELPYVYSTPEPTPIAQDIFSCPIPTPAALFNPSIPPPAPLLNNPVPPPVCPYNPPVLPPSVPFNPYLPVASPVSRWTEENLPTATCGTRSHYLRKIPIPPPTL